MWSDNYVSLLPGETRTLTARWRSEDALGATPTVAVDGWNVERK
jgi:exo-1,4-beta-D-glucosaminidase